VSALAYTDLLMRVAHLRCDNSKMFAAGREALLGGHGDTDLPRALEELDRAQATCDCVPCRAHRQAKALGEWLDEVAYTEGRDA